MTKSLVLSVCIFLKVSLPSYRMKFVRFLLGREHSKVFGQQVFYFKTQPSPQPQPRKQKYELNNNTQYCAKFVEKIRKPNIYRHWACRSLFLKVVFVVGVMLNLAVPCYFVIMRYRYRLKKQKIRQVTTRESPTNIHIEA